MLKSQCVASVAMRKLEKTLISANLITLGNIGKMALFILPPTGRVLGVYKKSDQDCITARINALLDSGGVCIPFESFESFISDLIASLNGDEHEALSDTLIDKIK